MKWIVLGVIVALALFIHGVLGIRSNSDQGGYDID